MRPGSFAELRRLSFAPSSRSSTGAAINSRPTYRAREFVRSRYAPSPVFVLVRAGHGSKLSHLREPCAVSAAPIFTGRCGLATIFSRAHMPDSRLTDTQSHLLEAIRTFTELYEFPPLLRDLPASTGKSRENCDRHLEELVANRWVRLVVPYHGSPARIVLLVDREGHPRAGC